MLNAFLQSFSLKNTYRVNAILYAIKQIPLVGRLFTGFAVSGERT